MLGLLLLVSKNNSNDIISIPLSSSPIAFAGLLKNSYDSKNNTRKMVE